MYLLIVIINNRTYFTAFVLTVSTQYGIVIYYLRLYYMEVFWSFDGSMPRDLNGVTFYWLLLST